MENRLRRIRPGAISPGDPDVANTFLPLPAALDQNVVGRKSATVQRDPRSNPSRSVRHASWYISTADDGQRLVAKAFTRLPGAVMRAIAPNLGEACTTMLNDGGVRCSSCVSNKRGGAVRPAPYSAERDEMGAGPSW